MHASWGYVHASWGRPGYEAELDLEEQGGCPTLTITLTLTLTLTLTPTLTLTLIPNPNPNPNPNPDLGARPSWTSNSSVSACSLVWPEMRSEQKGIPGPVK